jgi:BCCT, betaine/carnitine/choline family transporter
VWELCVYGLFAPTGYCLVWFCTMGGVGLRQSRQALELQQVGAVYFNNSRHFVSPRSEFCYDVPQENVLVDNELVFTNHLPGVTPVCLLNTADSDTAAFNVLNSFRFPDTFEGDGLGSTLSLLFIVASAMYSVTSCDSACLVVDNLASSGRRHMHWARRMFWSLTIGALATALLSSGGEVALQAFRAASILCGLPFALTLVVMMQSILLLCRAAEQPTRSDIYQFPNQPEFSMPIYGGIYNALEYVASFGKVNPARIQIGIHRPTKKQTVEFGKGVFIPYVSLWQVVSQTYPQNPVTNAAVVLFYALCYLGWFVCMCLYKSHPEFFALGWTMFMAATCTLCKVRSGFRAKYNLRSNDVADLSCSLLFWPQVLAQMRIHAEDVATLPKPNGSARFAT